MNPFDPAAFADFWRTGAQTMLDVQKHTMAQASRAMVEGMEAVARGKLPDMPHFQVESADMEKAGAAFSEMWSAASTHFASLAARFPAFPGSAIDGPAADTFASILDPARFLSGPGEMDAVLARMSEGPRLADLFDTERRFARLARAWAETRRAALEHATVTLGAWMTASRRFGDALSARAAAQPPGNAPLEPKAALALWTDIANRELLAAQRSDAFLRTQAANIRAATELRVAQTELVEHYGKQYGFPTRTELDDVHRTVTELRREIRHLKRRVDHADKAAAAAAAAPPPPPPARPFVPPPPVQAARPNPVPKPKATRRR